MTQQETIKLLQSAAADTVSSEEVHKKVFHPRPRSATVRVQKEGDTFVVEAPELERIVAGVDLNSPEVLRQLKGQLARAGVNKALEKVGVKPGDTVRCGQLEWRW